MKFLLIANNDTDGIGQPVVNLFNNLLIRGHDTKIIVLHKFINHKNIIKIKRSFLSRLFAFSLGFLKKDFKELFGFDYLQYLSKYLNILSHIYYFFFIFLKILITFVIYIRIFFAESIVVDK